MADTGPRTQPTIHPLHQAHLVQDLRVLPTKRLPIMPQQLGSKDSSLFRQVVRHYENKQYKKGLCYEHFAVNLQRDV